MGGTGRERSPSDFHSRPGPDAREFFQNWTVAPTISESQGASTMRAASAIYLVTGLAYLGWGVTAIVSDGLPISWAGLRYWGATAAFLYVAYGLIRAAAGARWLALFVSATLVVGSGVVLFAVFLPPIFRHPFWVADISLQSWAIISGFLIVCVAHLTAIFLLLFAKRWRTDPSLPTP
jgi:hypothetical protein